MKAGWCVWLKLSKRKQVARHRIAVALFPGRLFDSQAMVLICFSMEPILVNGTLCAMLSKHWDQKIASCFLFHCLNSSRQHLWVDKFASDSQVSQVTGPSQFHFFTVASQITNVQCSWSCKLMKTRCVGLRHWDIYPSEGSKRYSQIRNTFVGNQYKDDFVAVQASNWGRESGGERRQCWKKTGSSSHYPFFSQPHIILTSSSFSTLWCCIHLRVFLVGHVFDTDGKVPPPDLMSRDNYLLTSHLAPLLYCPSTSNPFRYI